MSAETRERIAGVIAEMDFRPNALARSLKQKRTHTLAAIVANILNPFSTSVIRGAEDYCKKSGMNLILCNADEDPRKEREYIEMLLAKQVDGLIINTTGHNNQLIKAVSANTPVVLIDRKVPEIQCDTVSVDGMGGSRLAIGHLVGLGQRRIAMLTQPFANISPREERVQGYKAALAEQGLVFDPALLVETDPEETVVTQKIKALIDAKERPGAIFCGNNLIAMAAVKALKRLGLSMPKDIAVLGFDDWEWAALIDPPITVVAQPDYKMGSKAAAMVIKRIKTGKIGEKPSIVIYQPELIVRKSCGER